MKNCIIKPWENAQAEKLSHKIEIIKDDFQNISIHDLSVVFVFLPVPYFTKDHTGFKEGITKKDQGLLLMN